MKKKVKKTIKKPIKKAKKTVKKAVKKPTEKSKKTVKKAVKSAQGRSASGGKVVKEDGQLIGKIIHYYDHIEVGIIELNKGALEVGSIIKIKGTTTDFEQNVKSMQIEHEQINKAKKGDVIGLKVKDKTREGDLVYKV